jgi:hypothetical protein
VFNERWHFTPSFNLEEHLNPDEMSCYNGRAKTFEKHFKWSTALETIWRNSLVHISLNVPGKICYYQSVDAMMANRVTTTSPEMFLERYLYAAPMDLKTAWKVEVLGHVLPTVHFIENNDPDGWFGVYNTGPGSCMQGRQQVRQYAHPGNNLALAYLKREDGRITHRTIVNKKEMKYLRIYGISDNYFFSAVLKKLGYSQSERTLEGEIIHINHLSCENCGREIPAGPYLDGEIHGVEVKSGASEGVISESGEEICYGNTYECEDCPESDSHDEDEDDA